MLLQELVTQICPESKRLIAEGALKTHQRMKDEGADDVATRAYINIPLMTAADGYMRLQPEGTPRPADLEHRIERLVLLELADPGNTFEAGLEAAAAYHDETVEILKETSNVKGVDKVIARHRTDASFIRGLTRKT